MSAEGLNSKNRAQRGPYDEKDGGRYSLTKGRFTRYDFVACDKFTTSLRHELFRVNQTYNALTTVVYVKKIIIGF